MNKCECCGDNEATGSLGICADCFSEFFGSGQYLGLSLNEFKNIKKNKKLIQQRSKKIKNILDEKM
jgi:hypothetical protein